MCACFRAYLAADAEIIHGKNFYDAVCKVMSGEEKSNEKRVVQALRVDTDCEQPNLEETEDLSPVVMAALLTAKSNQ